VTAPLAWLLAGFLLLWLWLIAWTIHRLTRPVRRTFASAVVRGRPGDPSMLPPRDDGTTRPWRERPLAWRDDLLPVWEVDGDDPLGPVVVLTHGWGDSRVGGLSRVPAIAPHASKLLLWDMPGHGDAPGTCTLGTREVYVLRRLLESVDGESAIVLLGWSLGAGVSIAALASWSAPHAHRVKGVIAEAPYRFPWTPARNVLRHFGMVTRGVLTPAMGVLGWRLGLGPAWDRNAHNGMGSAFDRARFAAHLPCPLLVLHGEEDQVCPSEDGVEIARAAKHGSCVLVEGAGHFGLWTRPEHSEAVSGAVVPFLRAARAATVPEG
jgi:pimeloyl-ACP methyl ester carboxylesterase